MEDVPGVDGGFWKGMFYGFLLSLGIVAVLIWVLTMAVSPKPHEIQALFDTEHPGVPMKEPAPPENNYEAAPP